MTYSAGQDPLCYSGSTVLKNKANLLIQTDLDAFEFEMFLTRSREPLPDGSLDIQHYQAVHRHLFQDVYDWAGSFRAVRIGKNGSWFCYPEFIGQNMTELFDRLSTSEQFAEFDVSHFPKQAAIFLAELNAIHPFREGNGRSQMAFLGLLLGNAGFAFKPENIDHRDILQSMILSFRGKLEPLEIVVRKLMDD